MRYLLLGTFFDRFMAAIRYYLSSYMAMNAINSPDDIDNEIFPWTPFRIDSSLSFDTELGFSIFLPNFTKKEFEAESKQIVEAYQWR